jgi:hypothetical protein
MKYFSQAQLIVASLLAEKRGYNRQIETDLLWKNTKATDKFPDGQSVQIDTDTEIFETLEDL